MFSLEAGRIQSEPKCNFRMRVRQEQPVGKEQQINKQTSNSLKLEINIVYTV